MNATTLAKTPQYCFATWQDVLINVWLGGGADVASLTKLAELTERFSTERKAKIYNLTVIVPGGKMGVTPEVREASTEFSKKNAQWVDASAFVLEGEGLRVTSLRLMLAGIAMVAKPPYEQKICRNVEEAGAFFAPRSELVRGAGGAAALAQAVDGLRR